MRRATWGASNRAAAAGGGARMTHLVSNPVRMTLLAGVAAFATSPVSTIAQATLPTGHTISVRHGDITSEDSDVIVNAANRHLRHGGGVAGAISRKGGPAIQAESNDWVARHGALNDGNVAVTSAGNLPARYVVHAVGPVWHGGGDQEETKLEKAVLNSLKKAEELQARSVALPAISSGIFGFPKERCAEIMVQTTTDFYHQQKPTRLKDVRLTNFDAETVGIFKRKLTEKFPAARVHSEL